MEEIYSDNYIRSETFSDVPWSSKGGKFLSQSSQHQRTFIPLWNSGAHNMPHSQSRYCKEFMDEKFVEVIESPTIIIR